MNHDIVVDIVDLDIFGKIHLHPSTIANNIFISPRNQNTIAIIPTEKFCYRIKTPKEVFPITTSKDYAAFSAEWLHELISKNTMPFFDKPEITSAPIGPKVSFIDNELLCNLPFIKSPQSLMYMYADKFRQIVAFPVVGESYMKCVECPSILSAPKFLTTSFDEAPFSTGQWIKPLSKKPERKSVFSFVRFAGLYHIKGSK